MRAGLVFHSCRTLTSCLAALADMTKRDSRIMSRLETRRGFIPLEDCEPSISFGCKEAC